MHYSKEAALQREKYLKSGAGREWFKKEVVDKPENFEPASVLLEKIRQEKERLIKEKKIKRDKNASIIYRGDDNSYYEKILATGEVKCIDDEVTFEIPKGWEWVRLEAILNIGSARRVHAKDWRQAGIPFYRAREIGKLADYGFVDNELYIDHSLYEDFSSSGVPLPNDLMITAVGTLGKVYIVKESDRFYYKDGSVLCMANKYGLYAEYLKMVIESPFFKGQYRQESQGTTVAALTMVRLQKYFIPLPPLQEQKRIVEKIAELLPQIERYNKAQEKLDNMNIILKDVLQKSILQEAIQGKLVPQIAGEGTAQQLLEQIKTEKQKLVKEGKLKKFDLNDSVIFRGDDNKYWEKLDDETDCIDEEISFEIPPNWTWVRLDDICSFIHRGKSPKYSLIKKYPVVAQKCNQWSGFSIEKAKFIEPQSISSYKEEYILQDEDLMWNSTGLGTLGRMAIYYKKLNPYELAVADSHVTVIRPYKQYVVSKFLYYYFASNTVQSVIEDKSDGSTKQKELSTKTVKSYLVPLPPKEEQKRIVVKIKKLTQLLK
ncbi:restriction endonuclease subunit S [Hoylesella timonensis]|uniref:Restriction endonuclease subunit S n=2 Tax=Hoylesella timonensis TaxID=386414 RepID=A0A2N6Q4S9_9BACT|nr:restriction endonuclease subunit S [Hoylesella timonensis]